MYKRCPVKGCEYRTSDFARPYCARCGKDLVIQLERGDRLEAFVVVSAAQSGRGGMGTVYRARHQTGAGDVALKIAHGKPFQFDALFREADCLALLDHPNIVKILPLGQDGRQKNPYVHKVHLMGEPLDYLALRWVEGSTIRDLLAVQSRPPLADAVRIVATLADALAYAHERHVIHLDVKPANIMIERGTGQPILMDFGIARRTDRPSPTISEKNLGTAGYMAPEHVKGAVLDARADIFSLGVVLYELLTATEGGPFKKTKTDETLAATLEMPAPPPSSLIPLLDKRWDKLLARALAKRPEERYQSMAEFKAAMLAAASGRKAGAATPKPARQRAAPSAKPRRSTGARVVLIVLAILLVGAFTAVAVAANWFDKWFVRTPKQVLEPLATLVGTLQPGDLITLLPTGGPLGTLQQAITGTVNLNTLSTPGAVQSRMPTGTLGLDTLIDMLRTPEPDD